MSRDLQDVKKVDVQNLDITFGLADRGMLPAGTLLRQLKLSQVRRRLLKLSVFGIGRLEIEDTTTTIDKLADEQNDLP